jgi:hypothetical protein
MWRGGCGVHVIHIQGSKTIIFGDIIHYMFDLSGRKEKLEELIEQSKE